MRDWRTLERAFIEDSYPSSAKQEQLAVASGLTVNQVKVWFQNRRNRWKRSTTKMAKRHATSSTLSSLAPDGSPLHPQYMYICVPRSSCKSEITPLPGYEMPSVASVDPAAMVPVRISRPVMISNDAIVDYPLRHELPATGMPPEPSPTVWPNGFMVHEPQAQPGPTLMEPTGNYFTGPTPSIYDYHGMQGWTSADGFVPCGPAQVSYMAPSSYA